MRLRMPLRAEPWTAGPHPFRPCPVCGVTWRPWFSSRLPCHAKCLLEPEDQDALCDELGTTKNQQAKRLGLTVAVFRASIAEALRRRG